MKIEKVSEYQIRCTLTKDDLLKHGLKANEIAYGTPETRELFKDMMDQASLNFGFVTDDMPIMVEAIPMNSECVVLVITKCDDPEELDSRFVSYAPSVFYGSSKDADYDSLDVDFMESDEDDDEDDEDADDEDELTDFSELFMRIQEGGMAGLFDSEQASAKTVKKRTEPKPLKYQDKAPYRIYSFPLLMDVMNVARQMNPTYEGKNTLYRDSQTGSYMLLLHSVSDEDTAFANLCLMLTEYGKEEPLSAANEEFLREHSKVIIFENALQTLKDRALIPN